MKEISTADNISTVVKSVDSQQHCAHLGTQSIQLDLDSQESLLPEISNSTGDPQSFRELWKRKVSH